MTKAQQRIRIGFWLLFVVAGVLIVAISIALRARISTPAEPDEVVMDQPTPIQAETSIQEEISTQPVAPSPDGSIMPEDRLDYPGEGTGATPKIHLSAGMYQISMRSESGFTRVNPVVTAGECSAYPVFEAVAGPFEGSATYRSLDCTLYFEIVGVSGDWHLEVQPAAESDVLTVPVSLAGDQPSVTGVIDLPVGQYIVNFETSSPYSMVIPIVVEGPCDERPLLVLSNAGTFEATYQSFECQIIFQVSTVTDSWQLTVSANTD